MAAWEELTPEEKEAVDELKRLTLRDLSPKLLEDETLFYRFCKARDFDVRNAEVMLRKHIQWRKEWRLDTVLHEWKILEVIRKYFSISLLGYDKKGRAVRYIDYGKGDLKALIYSAKLRDHIKYVFYNLEKDLIAMKENSRKLGIPVTQTIYIFNCGGLTFSNAMNRRVLQGVMTFAKCYLDNYPERLKYTIVINTSTAFKMGFPFVRQVLPHSVQQKIKVFASEGWQEFLRELMDEEVLPAFLGGKRTDPDGNPLCTQTIVHGVPIPKSYYLEERRLSEEEEGVRRVTVPSLAAEELCFEVAQEGSELVWEFETHGSRDIEFAVYFRGREALPLVELVPRQRVDGVEAGLLTCRRTGTYILVFDNSYSWIYSKDIFYRVGLKGPHNRNTRWT